MNPRWQAGDTLRVTRNVRDDGTYPGARRGELLVRRGSIGTVVDVGSFLGDQIIYALHFLECQRVIGCREEELIALDEFWVPSRFESRERVSSAQALRRDGEILIPAGAAGEILRVLREATGVRYEVHFDALPGRCFIVHEAALLAPTEVFNDA